MNPNNQTFLDARAPDWFKAGHVKNSRNFPLPKVINMDSKTMKTKDERKAAFEASGIDLNQNFIVACQGGIAASVLYASLSDISGGHVAVYDGSWAEYQKHK